MTVIDFCNKLIGPRQILELNADAIYVLLMGCYLHDVGMGISMSQFEEFSQDLPIDEYRQQHPNADIADTVRDFHQDLSAAFVRKFSDFLEIPSPEHVLGIMRVCQGHRLYDLYDREMFPSHFTAGDGNEVYLPYLASLIRLADEIDVTAARNPAMLYDIEQFSGELDINYHKRHKAVRHMTITDDAFTLQVTPCEPAVECMIVSMVDKMQWTLDMCKDVVASSTPFVISQERVIVERV